ncbi:MAG TPA: phosphotransferase [Solirubrobacteraceae bacterium]|nr:phosphotransferase [Solirubrobacteraceae bacterium]
MSEPEERRSHHGFEFDTADEALLRGPVPDQALRWVTASLGYGARVLAAEALAGGTSSAVHAVLVDTGASRPRELVLRRFVRLDWLAEEPDTATREAEALELLAGAELPTPRLVAVDPDGSDAGAPSVLMSRLPGRVEWDPVVVEDFLRALAEPLPVIHCVRVSAGGVLPYYRPYPVRMRRPPARAARPDVWERGFDVLDGKSPSDERLFVHRDYHPGNVLWEQGRVSGIVDWVNASIGSPWADVGHCRVNIASELGQEAADRFLDLYRAVSGRTDEYHPYWDISATVGGLDEDADAQPSPADELFLAAAVVRL